MPHVFGESIYDALDEIKEFETIEEMKEYLCNLPNRLIKIKPNDIVIDNKISHEDERLGWEDKRYVCLKQDDKKIVIGYCATKYKNLEETINRLKQENNFDNKIKSKMKKLKRY
jgi:hypothetical protein